MSDSPLRPVGPPVSQPSGGSKKGRLDSGTSCRAAFVEEQFVRPSGTSERASRVMSRGKGKNKGLERNWNGNRGNDAKGTRDFFPLHCC